MIKVVAFDYGGVLGTEADDWNGTFKKVLEISGLSNDDMLQIWQRHWQNLVVGKEEISSFWMDVGKKNDVDPEKLRETYNDSITINNEVFDFAKSLRFKFKLIVLSNDTKDWMNAKISRFKLLETFETVYCSANVGYSKPNKEIYEYVLKDQNIRPEELLFIDNQENNIEAAKQLGIKTILFKNISNLCKQPIIKVST